MSDNSKLTPNQSPPLENSSLSNSLGRKRKHEVEDDNWDSEDWGKYMKLKQRKLHDQFHGLQTPIVSSIFEGVTIYVNGWTQPNADELKEMIHSHGGNYEFNIYSNSKVTHTIATNLPNSKIKNLGNSIVCTPEWVVDSISAGKLLPVDDYQLYSQANSRQKRITFAKADQKVDAGKALPKSESAFNEVLSPSSPTDRLNEDALSKNFDENELETDDHPVSVAKSFRSSQGSKFVNEFFTHSRLHYLSVWSTELKQFTAKMLRQVTPKYPKLSSAKSLKSSKERALVHIDLDCFFVSVSIRNKPHLVGKPVAVIHAKLPKSDDTKPSDGILPKHLLDSTSDIASCSYAAREMDVRNGMPVGEAMKLCPELVLLPYDFENYRKVSQDFYESLLHYSSCVEAVSCDEAYIEFTDYVSDFNQVKEMVLELRAEIESKTQCTVSAGISHNMLLARMATRIAKPNGQYFLPHTQAEAFLDTQNVSHLPGVGYSTTRKLKEMNIENCSQLRTLSLEKLRDSFGSKTGKVLYEYARGVDSRELKVATERKSVSVDINYGIRFKELTEAESLISNLAKELEKRATDAEVLGGTVNLKMKVRQKSAPVETRKYLGHGACDNITRSFALLQPTRSAEEVTRLAIRLLKQIKPVASDIRGMGLQLSKLISTSSGSLTGQKHGSSLGVDLRNFMKPDIKTEELRSVTTDEQSVTPMNDTTTHGDLAMVVLPSSPAVSHPATNGASPVSKACKTSTKDNSFSIDLPPMSQLDSSVLEALPPSLREEILKGYANKLSKETENQPTTDVALFKLEEHDHHVSTRVEEGLKKNDNDTKVNPQVYNDHIVIDNDGKFLKEIRMYIKDWILNFIEGPPDSDIETFSEYLLRLTNANLDIASLALKAMRRFIVQLELSCWFSVFNIVLSQVQLRVTSTYGGQLLIDIL